MIAQLDLPTANRIAAGEVVERPASVIKELVENAIDAGATAITVEIENGGISAIRVTDNGSGMDRADAELCFARHATSKIASGDDLMRIGTLGFRGEALAAIAAVSRVTLTTRLKGAQEGTLVRMEGGEQLLCQQAGCPEGTSIQVLDLFYNTPARLKFLKTPAAEAGAIGDYLLRLSLARPDIALRLRNQGKVTLHTPGDGKLLSAIRAVYGSPLDRQVIPVSGQSGYCKLRGFVGVGEASRRNRTGQTLVVDGRWVRSALVAQAVEAALEGRVMIGRFPFYVLHLQLPLEAVDVNVHPGKLEIRFREENLVRQAVGDLVKIALRNPAPAPELLVPPQRAQNATGPTRMAAPERPMTADPAPTPRDRVAPPAAPAPSSAPNTPSAPCGADASRSPVRPPQPPRFPIFDQPERANLPEVAESAFSLAEGPPAAASPRDGAPSPVVPEPGKPAPWEAPAQREVVISEPPAEQMTLPHALQDAPVKVLGQVFRGYVVAQQGDCLYIIDQHAAHERLLYERFSKQFAQGPVATQPLMLPVILQVDPAEQALIQENLPLLVQAGFTLEPFGGRSWRVTEAPMLLGEPEVKDCLEEVLASLSTLGRLPRQVGADRIIRMSCRKAVKAGDPLQMPEIEALLREMTESGAPPTCPHGRPVLIAITERELQKRFKRIV
ncbi:MAG: DNA mismatch repair endonuclease MutL [Christensenellales bacterium]|jgi:DNA mismatch repair protein MutL